MSRRTNQSRASLAGKKSRICSSYAESGKDVCLALHRDVRQHG
jgi:hypothetical protein